MPIVELFKQSFPDPLKPQLYGDIIVPSTEFSSIGGLGTPESNANVTGDHIFLDPSTPDPKLSKEGDIWYDSNDSNHPYKFVNGVWVSIQDTGVVSGPDVGEWANNLVFSATDFNTIAWGAGTIKLKSGTTYAIGAGNTGNMGAITYIFLDIAVSLVVLQTTTTMTNAVGSGRKIVAVAKPNAEVTKSAEFQVFGGFGQTTFITADNIAANTITANEIAANTITADRMNVATLSAISADLGTITAGTITGGTFQTSALATVGIKFDSVSLRGYDAANNITFQISPVDGTITASKIILTGLQPGSSVDGTYLAANSVASASANLALRGWTQTSLFSVTDADTVAWGAGTFIASDGTSYAIGAGNTGNMAAKTYIYLDITISTIAYQTTTTATTAIGNGKVLIAIAQNGTTEASFMLLNNNQYNIDAANIVAGSITANEIAASTITANKLSVTTLSAISADMGTITAGTITGATFQTSALANTGIKFDSTSLRGYDALNALTFELSPINGTFTVSKIILTGLQAGSSLDGVYLAANSVGSASANLAMRGWIQTSVFSSTDLDTVSWGAGTFTASDGTAYAIGAGNTGNMGARTYIYLDIAVSTIAYQTTAIAANAVGNGKVMIATAINGATEASFQVFGGLGGLNIEASNIVAGSITANEIAASTITAGLLSVTTLSSITADMGTLTAGTITLNATGYIRSGQTDYDTGGAGFFLGRSGGITKFSIGTGDQSFKYDGSNVLVNNSSLAFQDAFGDGSDGNVTIAGDTTLTTDVYYNNLTVNNGVTLNTGNYRVFVKTLLTNSGTIACVGGNGGNGTDGSGTNAGATGGTAGAAVAAGFFVASTAGKAADRQANKGTGSTFNNANATSGDDGFAGTAVSSLAMGVSGVGGGNGGDGGDGYGTPGSGGVGGGAGAATPPTNKIRSLPELIVFRDYTGTTVTKLNGSAGSGSGGMGGGGCCNGTDGTGAEGGGAGTGGGSGASGGIMLISAAKIINTGTISCKGGNGGNGGNGADGVAFGSDNASGGGGGGGGGGGSGGVMILIYKTLLDSGTITVDGGSGGTGGSGGSFYNGGLVGADGNTGSNGNTGTKIQIPI